jgi:Protein of unknown function, DUF547
MSAIPILTLVLLACQSAGAPPQATTTVDHSVFDKILRENVRDERVDYKNIRAKSLGDLDKYLAALAAVDVKALPKNEQLAYDINLYNATVIKAVIAHDQPGYSPAKDNYALFKEPIVKTGGKTLSLDALEKEVILPTFKDPRAHVALVCAARSCPPILPRAYRGDDLDKVLDENMKRFVADRFRNPIDDAKKELKLSRIFDWYAADFGGKDKVKEYVGKIAGKDYSGYTVSFVEYSWDLNEVQSPSK